SLVKGTGAEGMGKYFVQAIFCLLSDQGQDDIKAANLGSDKNEDIYKLLEFIRERPGELRGGRSPPTAWMARKWAPHVLSRQRPIVHRSDRGEFVKRWRSRSPERGGKGQQPHRAAASTSTTIKSWKDSSHCRLVLMSIASS
ncbi:hypothetical protein BG011_003426, partial [Mortierella polycephala]